MTMTEERLAKLEEMFKKPDVEHLSLDGRINLFCFLGEKSAVAIPDLIAEVRRLRELLKQHGVGVNPDKFVYNTSRDYHYLKFLLDKGTVLLGFVDYNWDGSTKFRDPVHIRKTDEHEYRASARGIGYCESWESLGGWQEFEKQCRKYDLEFVLPNCGEVQS
jgi:hypothetical protein